LVCLPSVFSFGTNVSSTSLSFLCDTCAAISSWKPGVPPLCDHHISELVHLFQQFNDTNPWMPAEMMSVPPNDVAVIHFIWNRNS
jgi:hypothetical protein